MKKEMATKSAFGESVKTYIERGELVPDDIVLPVVKKILTQPTYKSGVILDGFPRTVAQAEDIAKSLPIDLVMYFHLPREILIEKLLGRRYD
jgi:adenylate kinase